MTDEIESSTTAPEKRNDKFGTVSETPTLSYAFRAWDSLVEIECDRRAMRNGRLILSPAVAGSAKRYFEAMATKLRRSCTQHGWSTIMLASPTAGSGRTTICANLALALSERPECRIAVLDLDLKGGHLLGAFHPELKMDITQFLAVDGSVATSFLRYGNNLALAGMAGPASNMDVVIHGGTLKAALSAVRAELDPTYILINSPPLVLSNDADTIARHVDCALVVAAAGQTKARDIESCISVLSEYTNILGVILNQDPVSDPKGDGELTL
jgi:protein-tyrosine kinase